jgi:hypothetical protein
MAKNKSKSKTHKKTRKYPFPKKYYQGLSKKDKESQIKELKKSQALYKKGVFIGRTQKDSFKSKKSAHIVEFEEKYRISINDKKAVFKATGVTLKAQDEIISKGMGAFYSSGSRPNQSAQSWALARLASVILKHGAYKVDRHILVKYDCDNIKKPNKSGGYRKPKSKRVAKSKSKRGAKSLNKSLISCCKITEKNEHKFKECERKSDHKVFELPRRFNRTSCKNIRGFTMKSSCAPYTPC